MNLIKANFFDMNQGNTALRQGNRKIHRIKTKN